SRCLREGPVNRLTLSAATIHGLATGPVALQLGGGPGADITLIEGSEGGTVFATVVTEPTGPGAFPKKHLRWPQDEDIVIHLGMSMPDEWFEWIAAAWTAQAQTKDGAVLATDFKLDVRTALSFTGALITELTVPTLDAAAKEPGLLTVTFSPATV